MNTQFSPASPRARARPDLNVLPSACRRGTTVLLVEDSRLISDAIRLMFRDTGGRLRRAETLCRARRHLSLYTPDVAIIDLGLPDGSGLELIREAVRRQMRVPLIIAISGQPELEGAAYAAGADRFIPKPIVSVAEFRAAFASACFPPLLPKPEHPATPPDPCALRDDLFHALNLLEGAKQGERNTYALQFIEGLGRTLQDTDLLDAIQLARQGEGLRPLAQLVRRRLCAQPLI